MSQEWDNVKYLQNIRIKVWRGEAA